MKNINTSYQEDNRLLCYGREYSVHKQECMSCVYKQDCIDSQECNRVIFAGDTEYDVNRVTTHNSNQFFDDARYSSSQVVNLTRLLLAMDDKKVRELVLYKLEMPDVTLAELADKYQVSRQAIHKAFNKASKQFPALRCILHNKPQYSYEKRHWK